MGVKWWWCLGVGTGRLGIKTCAGAFPCRRTLTLAPALRQSKLGVDLQASLVDCFGRVLPGQALQVIALWARAWSRMGLGVGR